jgi:hypothetical protein
MNSMSDACFLDPWGLSIAWLASPVGVEVSATGCDGSFNCAPRKWKQDMVHCCRSGR